MRALKFIILAIAAVAGLGAVALVQGELERARNAPQVQFASEPAEVAKAKVLVAARKLQIGTPILEGDVEWREWPVDFVSETWITEEAEPDALNTMQGAVVRAAMSAGDPVLDEKVLRHDDANVMSTLLRDDMRAVAVPIAASSAAGGFVQPNDFVDVILSRQISSPVHGEDGETVVRIDTVLKAVRVLAIDQTLGRDANGEPTVGETATLEVYPDQAEILWMSTSAGELSLALRGVSELLPEGSEVPEMPTPQTHYDPRLELQLKVEEARMRAEADAEAAKQAAEEAEQALGVQVVRWGMSQLQAGK